MSGAVPEEVKRSPLITPVNDVLHVYVRFFFLRQLDHRLHSRGHDG